MTFITRAIRKIYGSAVIAASLKGQRRVPFLSRKELERIRDRRVRSIVLYAAKNVPYYRDLFSRMDLDPHQIQSASDLERLPILDKGLVRKDPHLFIAETTAGRNAVSFYSSGSTGIPMEIHHDRHSLLRNIAFGERERETVIRMCGGSFRPKELYVGYETSTFKNVVAFYEDSVLFPVRPQRRFLSMSDPIEKIADIINQERPEIISAYGGWIHLFFKTITARDIRIHLPKMVMYMGEALPPGGREFIEKDLGLPLLSRYNTVEAFKIGFFCEKRTGFHLHEDLCHVRIVGLNGEAVADGEQGQIVMSNLVNRGSVLLNYPVGDVASISSGECSCGRSFRMLSELEGRVEDVLSLEGGGFIHPRMIWQVFKNDRDVLQYQLTQHEYNRFTLMLVTVDDSTFQKAIHRALPDLKQLLGTEVRIEAHRQTEFSRETGKKFRAVVGAKQLSTQVSDVRSTSS